MQTALTPSHVVWQPERSIADQRSLPLPLCPVFSLDVSPISRLPAVTDLSFQHLHRLSRYCMAQDLHYKPPGYPHIECLA